MQLLFSLTHHHPATVTPAHYHHHTTFTQPSRRFKPNVSCNLFADHGELRSTRAEFTRPNFLFTQPITHQNTWQLHSTRRLAPANGATKGLILANVAVYLLSKVADAKFMRQNFAVHLDNFNSGRYHTMITSAFSHKHFLHIVPNMIALYSYGKSIEKQFGPEFLLKLYLAGAFTGSVSFLLSRVFLALSSKDKQDKQSCESDRSKLAVYGASYAVMAILMLDTLLTPRIISLGKFTIPAHALLAGSYIWDDIQKLKEDNKIAGSAHLGGAAAGIITWACLRKGWL